VRALLDAGVQHDEIRQLVGLNAANLAGL
jgi:hypothetical protein